MILENAIPRLEKAIELSISEKQPKEVAFLYHELRTIDTISSVFNWIYEKGVDFQTRRDDSRFVIIVNPLYNSKTKAK